MPATGPGVASVRASVTRATIRQAIDRRLAHASAQARTAVSVAAIAVQTRLALQRFPDLVARVLQRSHQSGKRPGGRPAQRGSPPDPARPPDQTVKRQSRRVADQGHEHAVRKELASGPVARAGLG